MSERYFELEIIRGNVHIVGELQTRQQAIDACDRADVYTEAQMRAHPIDALCVGGSGLLRNSPKPTRGARRCIHVGRERVVQAESEPNQCHLSAGTAARRRVER
jgi:hypothetical protein